MTTLLQDRIEDKKCFFLIFFNKDSNSINQCTIFSLNVILCPLIKMLLTSTYLYFPLHKLIISFITLVVLHGISIA